ncbi:GroES-like protein [Acaromyces ingoldii]|uniref:alcohol dehydrogenase n=1 Tax=Acaromyces ingoldii TaxID=215250 RepID=A0A316YEA2_9BASI|nr:GroES-like protein [Acaromyces ingoldii]PWN87441.1 GroES-like protein [Acaromyces ingoldii]
MATKGKIDPRERDMNVPKEQTVAIFRQKGGPLSVEKAPVQKPQKGEALVHVIYSGVCHTDLHAMLGDWPLDNKLPLIGGHEGAGVVVQLGPGADEYVKVGDRVGIKWLADSCLKCDQCRRGHEPNCSQAQCSGFTMDGSFQQYAIASARHLTPIPDSLDLETASPLLCAGVTVYRAVKEARLTPGETVAIVGAGGGLGHLAVQYAVNAGYRVIAIDSGAEKEKLARSLGAEAFVDFAKEKDLVQAVKDTTADKQGPSAAIVAASGGKAYEQALDYLRPRGTLVAVGLPPDTNIQANVFFTVFKALHIVGSYVGNRQDAIESLDIAGRGKVKVIHKTVGLSSLPDIYDQMHAGKIAGRIVLDLDK